MGKRKQGRPLMAARAATAASRGRPCGSMRMRSIRARASVSEPESKGEQIMTLRDVDKGR